MDQMNVQMDELIARRLCGETTAEEDAVVEEWLREDPERGMQYAAQEAQWKEVEVLLKSAEFDTDAAWNKVAQQTVMQHHPERKARLLSWRMVSMAAAAVLLLGVVIYKATVPGGGMIEMVAAGGNMELVLPDNTHVTLHEGSRLSYASAFSGRERRVALEGEAFFKVHRDEQHPFVIDAQAGEVRVLGTAFNVKCSKDMASVAVVEGKVQFTSGVDKKQFVILTRGQRAWLNTAAIERGSTEDENFLYWKTGVIKYKERELQAIAAQLSEIFETKVVLDQHMMPEQQQQKVTVAFAGQGLEAMLSEICLVTQCKWIKTGEKEYSISARGQ